MTPTTYEDQHLARTPAAMAWADRVVHLLLAYRTLADDINPQVHHAWHVAACDHDHVVPLDHPVLTDRGRFATRQARGAADLLRIYDDARAAATHRDGVTDIATRRRGGSAPTPTTDGSTAA